MDRPVDRHVDRPTDRIVDRVADRIADRIVFMKEGRIYWEGTPDEMRASDDPELQDFISGRSDKTWPGE